MSQDWDFPHSYRWKVARESGEKKLKWKILKVTVPVHVLKVVDF